MSDSPELARLYRIRFPERELARKSAIWQVLCRDWFQKYIDPSATVIDVACGFGEFINHIAAARRIAVDLNPEAEKRLAKGVEFHCLPATQLGTLGRSIADVVFASNFLEHLPDKATLDAFLDEVRATLRPGGRFIVMGPNLRYLPGKYWDFYDHHLGLTHLSLTEALRLRGFEVDVCIDRFLPFTTQGKLPTHPFLVSLYLKVPAAWPLLGKQFFFVASSPAQPDASSASSRPSRMLSEMERSSG